ncbi:MAG: hypothetical protein WCA15_17015, partial [Candidatus Acidiferrales bacterium]
TRVRRERIALLRMGAGHAPVGSGSSRKGIVFSAATFRVSRMGKTPVNLKLRQRLTLLPLLELHNPKQRRIERVPVRTAQNVARPRRTRTAIPAIRKSRTYEPGAISHQKLFKSYAPARAHIEKKVRGRLYFREKRVTK